MGPGAAAARTGTGHAPAPAPAPHPSADLNPAMQALLSRAVDLSSFVQLYEAPQAGTGVQTRSGRISRPPPPPPPPPPQQQSYNTPEADTPGTDGGGYASGEGPGGNGPSGRPAMDAEERLNRQRQRNRRSAFESRQRRKEAQDETRRRLEEKNAQVAELEDRCKELEAQVRELQATLQAHGLPLPTVPGPAKPPPSSRYWGGRGEYAAPQDMAHTPHNAHANVAAQAHAMQNLPARQQYLYQNGLEALANAALPQLPVSSPDVRSLVAANAAASGPSGRGQQASGTHTGGALATTLTPTLTSSLTTPAPQLSAADPDIAAALEALNPLAHEWRLDDDAISLSALFNIDDLGEDANDADFVPPTSPKADSSDDEDDDADGDEEEGDDAGDKASRPRKRRRVGFADDDDDGAAAEPADADTDDEDLFLPIEDVPIPIDELYRDALAALGVSTQEELAAVVSKIVETASRGGVTPEQVEGLRRLMRLAEAQGASKDNAAAQ